MDDHSTAVVRPRDGGFTLVEVMLSISVLAILTLSTLLSIVPISRQNRVNREIELAMAEVRNQLEQIQSTPFNDLLVDFPPATTVAIADLTNGAITIDYEDVTADPLVVRLDVQWDLEDGGQIQRRFFAVRTE